MLRHKAWGLCPRRNVFQRQDRNNLFCKHWNVIATRGISLVETSEQSRFHDRDVDLIASARANPGKQTAAKPQDIGKRHQTIQGKNGPGLKPDKRLPAVRSLTKTRLRKPARLNGKEPLVQNQNTKGLSSKGSLQASQKGQSQNHVVEDLQDEAYIRREFYVPTATDYSGTPPAFFDPVRIKGTWHNHVRDASLRKEFTSLPSSNWRCNLHLETPKRQKMVIGDGTSLKLAERTAYIRLLCELHQEGVLGQVLNSDSAAKPDVSGPRDDRDGIIDVFNYAAKFGAVPTIDIQEIKRARHLGRAGRKGQTFLQATLALAEQDINVTGHGLNRSEAEARAAANFKIEAEKYQAKTGNGNLIIKESTNLTTQTASKFFDFLKIKEPAWTFTATFAQSLRDSHVCSVFVNHEAIHPPLSASSKKRAEDFALLATAIELRKRYPDLYSQYLRALKAGNGEILKPVHPIDLDVDEDSALIMRETLLSARKAGLPDEVEEIVADDQAREVNSRRFRRGITAPADQLSKLLQERRSKFQKNPELAELRRLKETLPMNHFRTQVVEIVNTNQYSIIIGATGSGKTTQVPQILVDDMVDAGQGAKCNIICTQPRRIAARSVAQRVAQEKAEKLQETVGFHLRGESKIAPLGGSITYCTTGILLQQLQHMPDEVLDNISHLVIDEVHERDILIDFLLVLVKSTIARRKAEGKSAPQVVLMSATIDTELFANYFKSTSPDGTILECPTLSVPGRTFPVQEKYLDDILNDMRKANFPIGSFVQDSDSQTYLDLELALMGNDDVSTSVGLDADDRSIIDWKREYKQSSDGELNVDDKANGLVPVELIARTVAHITKNTPDGAILVFLPGLEEIQKVEHILRQDRSLGIDLNNAGKSRLYQLHSSVTDSQTTVFESVPLGCRKIILSTNIAETSVTIPEVQHVVDSGKLREKRYDQVRRITSLVCTWISKSNAKQRAGRAGRVQNGTYYAMYSKERYDSLRAIGLPEMLRSDLQEVCLDVKAQAVQMPVREFLAESIEPPPAKAVDISVDNLQNLDALTDEEEITPLGRLLAALPVHPNLGKMIVLGIIFRCLDPILILGSVQRSIFTSPPEARREALRAKIAFVEGTASDHIALLNAMRELRRTRRREGERGVRDFTRRNFLHYGAIRYLEHTAVQIEEILMEAGLIPRILPGQRRYGQFGGPALNENSHKIPLIKALLLAGVRPNLAVAVGGPLFRTSGENDTLLHPSSINAQDISESSVKREFLRYKAGKLFTFSNMARSNDDRSTYLRETSESTPLMAALFGGRLRRSLRSNHIIELDNWLPVYIRSPGRKVPQTVVEFRKALERILICAFKDLGSLAQSVRTGQMVQTYLADDKIRSNFAEGVADVLDRDMQSNEATKRRGWGGAQRD